MRRKLTDTAHPDESLTDEFWLRFGDNPQPAMHEKSIYLTMEHVRAKGPWDFNAAAICQRLGITNPMVNHYFGNRDGLLAAAVVAAWWDNNPKITVRRGSKSTDFDGKLPD